MPQTATAVYRFSGPALLLPEAGFDGGRLTSDGGLPWLERAEQSLGVCPAVIRVIAEADPTA